MTYNLKLCRSASLRKNILEGSLLICIRCVPGQHIPPAGRRWAYLRVAGAGEVGWINIFLKSKYFVRRGRRLARFCCQNTRNEYIYVKVLLQAMMQTFLWINLDFNSDETILIFFIYTKYTLQLEIGILTEEYIWHSFYHKRNSDIFHLNILISNIQ